MRHTRTLTCAALAGLALGGAWQLAGTAWAQGPAPSGDQAAPRKIENRIMITVDSAGGHGLAAHGAVAAMPAHDIVADIAAALGLGKDELLAEHKAGKTLDEIAAAHGTTKRALLDKVQEAMRAEHKARLDQAVADGQLTREQADKMLDGLKIMLDLDDLPVEGMPLPGAAGGHFFFKQLAPGGAPDEDFEFALPAMPASPLEGEDSWLPEPGEMGDVITLQDPLRLDDATVDAVRGVLTDAVAGGKLSQEQADKILRRLEPQRMPLIRMFRSLTKPGLDGDAAVPANPRAASPL